MNTHEYRIRIALWEYWVLRSVDVSGNAGNIWFLQIPPFSWSPLYHLPCCSRDCPTLQSKGCRQKGDSGKTTFPIVLFMEGSTETKLFMTEETQLNIAHYLFFFHLNDDSFKTEYLCNVYFRWDEAFNVEYQSEAHNFIYTDLLTFCMHI